MRQGSHSRQRGAVLLGPSSQNAAPYLQDSPREPLEGLEAGRNSIVTEPSINDLPKPLGNFVSVVVHPPTQLSLDTQQSSVDTFPDRLAPQSEASCPRGPAVVREPEEVECFGTSLTACPAVHRGELAELDEAGLVGV